MSFSKILVGLKAAEDEGMDCDVLTFCSHESSSCFMLVKVDIKYWWILTSGLSKLSQAHKNPLESTKSHFTSKVVYPILRRNTWNGPNQGELFTWVGVQSPSPPKESSNLPGWKMAMVQVLVGDGTCWHHHLWWGGYESYFGWGGGEGGYKRHVPHMCIHALFPREKKRKIWKPRRKDQGLHNHLRLAYCIWS